MCGISGYSGSLPASEDKLKLLMLYNESRGKDSCGFYFHGEGSVEDRIVRAVGAPSTEILPKYYLENVNVFMAHSRHATTGDKTEANAHPYLFKDKNGTLPPVVGVHNGVVSNRWDLNTKYNESYITLPVDSMLIFKYLQELNNTQILSELGDAANAILFTKDDGLLHAFRMLDRPLFRGEYTGSDDVFQGMYISSLKESLEAINCKKIKEFKQDFLYTIKDGRVVTQVKITRSPYSKPTTYYPATNNTNNAYSRVGRQTWGGGQTNSEWAKDDDVIIDFQETRFLGFDTDTKSKVANIMKDASYAQVTNIIDDEEDMVNNENKEDFISEVIAEHLVAFLTIAKSAVDDEAATLSESLKTNSYDVLETSVKGSITSLRSLSNSIQDEITYIETGDEEYKQPVSEEAIA